ncbi:MAG: flagellar FliJ family protein [Bacteroidetes bacterium]|nr:flagellar FliJ family protein [Bacteroidota bacterium]
MAKFNYKFASVQRIKNTIEKKVQKELSVIDLEIEKAKIKLSELEAEKKRRKEELKLKKSVKVAELNFYDNFEKNMIVKINSVEKEILNLETSRRIKQEELVEKSKETKMFEKLEIKHHGEFLKEQDKLEQIELDDIATKKFVRSMKK